MNSNHSYAHLAQYYDRLMDQDYHQWCDYLLKLCQRIDYCPKTVLELGCGTGNISILLATRGLKVTGVDFSEAMLEHAYRKALVTDFDIVFERQDIRELNVPGEYDLVVAACDTLNYITMEEHLASVFLSVHKHCRKDGVFLFDLNSEMKLREIYGNESYSELHSDFAYFWDNSFDEDEKICDMELTFFVQEQDGVYKRVTEHHQQKLWRPETIFKLANKTGWEIINYFGFLTFAEPNLDTERWQFVARKITI
ncbi:MAG: class I SAM-dependent methyltransferase [Firmicutes bacterium]|nr:class I SAM-dependent methyltransferase [Bacillota bacterium]